jgi:hypothetical protein
MGASPIASTALDRQVVRLHRLCSAIGNRVFDVAQRNSAFGQRSTGFVPSPTQWRCAMWRMSNAQALIFVALITIMVAVLIVLA